MQHMKEALEEWRYWEDAIAWHTTLAVSVALAFGDFTVTLGDFLIALAFGDFTPLPLDSDDST